MPQVARITRSMQRQAASLTDIELYRRATDFAPVYSVLSQPALNTPFGEGFALLCDPVDNAYIKLACHSRLTAEMSRQFQ